MPAPGTATLMASWCSRSLATSTVGGLRVRLWDKSRGDRARGDGEKDGCRCGRFSTAWKTVSGRKLRWLRIPTERRVLNQYDAWVAVARTTVDCTTKPQCCLHVRFVPSLLVYCFCHGPLKVLCEKLHALSTDTISATDTSTTLCSICHNHQGS